MAPNSIHELLKEQLVQFCLHTSLHGWLHTVLPEKRQLERWTWVLICLTSLSTALWLTLTAWFKFQESPTILVSDSKQYPIYHYPFPAVTICGYNKISKKRAYAFAEQTVGQANVSSFANELRLLTALITNDARGDDDAKLRRALDEHGLSAESVLERLAPSCGDELNQCAWKKEERKCSDIFERIATPDGFCCSFNYFGPKNHVFGGTLANKAPKLPRRVSTCGYQTGLEVFIKNDVDDYLAATTPSVGQKVVIHHPRQYPDRSFQFVTTSVDKTYLIGIHPDLVVTSENVRDLPVEQRRCAFARERDLSNFELYSYHNCAIEYKMNAILEYCGCLPFYYRNPRGSTANSKICTLDDVECLKNREGLLANSEPWLDSDGNGTSANYECPADCETAWYTFETSSGDLVGTYSFDAHSIYGTGSFKNGTMLRVYFADLTGTRHRRAVIFTWYTLLGFSFVSVIEIVYFFTIRLLMNLKKRETRGSKAAHRIRVYPKHLPIIKSEAASYDGDIRKRTKSK
ncbi:sodium channel protein Nach-like isoform X2 [Cylas formicarius]|uniref:sodium channel protein Nach-like isoform X2 n=1 Tax=Cylas formicarius TaxID=197179 RepID=UPI002958BE85|nr:sodium channel protein Nach-like isoform X2 [Cylas formicarius]